MKKLINTLVLSAATALFVSPILHASSETTNQPAQAELSTELANQLDKALASGNPGVLRKLAQENSSKLEVITRIALGRAEQLAEKNPELALRIASFAAQNARKLVDEQPKLAGEFAIAVANIASLPQVKRKNPQMALQIVRLAAAIARNNAVLAALPEAKKLLDSVKADLEQEITTPRMPHEARPVSPS